MSDEFRQEFARLLALSARMEEFSKQIEVRLNRFDQDMDVFSRRLERLADKIELSMDKIEVSVDRKLSDTKTEILELHKRASAHSKLLAELKTRMALISAGIAAFIAFGLEVVKGIFLSK